MVCMEVCIHRPLRRGLGLLQLLSHKRVLRQAFLWRMITRKPLCVICATFSRLRDESCTAHTHMEAQQVRKTLYHGLEKEAWPDREGTLVPLALVIRYSFPHQLWVLPDLASGTKCLASHRYHIQDEGSWYAKVREMKWSIIEGRTWFLSLPKSLPTVGIYRGLVARIDPENVIDISYAYDNVILPWEALKMHDVPHTPGRIQNGCV